MKRADSKTAEPRAPTKKRAVSAGVKSSNRLMDQMQEQQNLLELQNEQLCEARAELEKSQQRYADLYDQAPVGYLTLDGKGCVREINQTASQMLGWSSAHMLGRPLMPHLAAPDRKAWLKHLWESRRHTSQVITTLRLLPREGSMRQVQFATSRQAVAGPHAAWCRTAMLDITDTSDAQAALSVSEAKFRLLAENMGEVFWFMELDPPRVTYVSPAFERIWGVQAAELYTDHELWLKAIHADDLPAVHAAYHAWIGDTTDCYQIEYRVLHPSGDIHWISDRGIIISRREGRPHHLSGIARDITERKLAEKALAEKAVETTAILEGTQDGILIADVETRRFTFGNRAMCQMLGVTTEELLTMGMESIHPQETLPDLRMKFDTMARGELAFAENVPLLRKDGDIIPVDITGSPVVIKGRTCNIGIFHDISERKRGDERFRRLLEAAPEAMIIVNQRGLIDQVNAQTVNLFGYTRDELLGQSIEMLLPERFRERHVSHRSNYTVSAHARPMGKGMELFARHKDGGEFSVEISLSPLETAEGPVVISTVRDITERKLAEKALQSSEEKLRLFIEHSPAPVAMFDRAMHYLVASKCWSEVCGMSNTSLSGRSHYEVFPALPDAWKEMHQRCLAGATESCERDQFVHPDGHFDWIKWQCRPWHDSNGEVGGIILFVEIINDRVKAEEDLLKARRFAESTLESIPASIVVLDAQGKILSANHAWNHLAETNGGDIRTCGIGANYLAVCDSAASKGDEESVRFAKGIREVMSGEMPRFTMEYACPVLGPQRWFVSYVTPFNGNGGHSVVVAHVDVSERKRAEQVIRRLNIELEMRVEQRTSELKRTNQGLREEIANRRRLEAEILHISEREQQRISEDLHDDLGQRLAGIWLQSDVLNGKLSELGLPEAAHASQISDLLKDSLELTRSLSRGLHPVAIGNGGLVAALNELTARTNKMFNVNCRCHCQPTIELDATTSLHLYRIAQEAITNAVKHGEANEILIELTTAPRHIFLSVKDNGKGLPVCATRSEGMGLHIMKYRADMIGGVLKLKNNRDTSGTLVTCKMPTPVSVQ
jgi:PAS domain S-box-containing protein